MIRVGWLMIREPGEVVCRASLRGFGKVGWLRGMVFQFDIGEIGMALRSYDPGNHCCDNPMLCSLWVKSKQARYTYFIGLPLRHLVYPRCPAFLSFQYAIV